MQALQAILKDLPADLPASVLIVLHTTPRAVSLLPEIFARDCVLPVTSPNGISNLQCGHVYIALPDRHLLVENSHVAAVMGPKKTGIARRLILYFVRQPEGTRCA